MRRHYKYLSYVLRHKWFVLLAGLKLRVPIHLLILHDISKFYPSEWFAYARTFYSPSGKGQFESGTSFDMAWNAHQKRNKHHWQYWMLNMDDGGRKCLPMPPRYRKEMLADWMGAGRAITGTDNTLEWYTNNRHKMKLHPETRTWIEEKIGYTSVQWETVSLKEFIRPPDGLFGENDE